MPHKNKIVQKSYRERKMSLKTTKKSQMGVMATLQQTASLPSGESWGKRMLHENEAFIRTHWKWQPMAYSANLQKNALLFIYSIHSVLHTFKHKYISYKVQKKIHSFVNNLIYNITLASFILRNKEFVHEKWYFSLLKSIKLASVVSHQSRHRETILYSKKL